jgi:hypothetical protein
VVSVGCCCQAQAPDLPKIKRELQTLLHPEMLGRAFQALALAKDIDPGASRLAGFKFARVAGLCVGSRKAKSVPSQNEALML